MGNGRILRKEIITKKQRNKGTKKRAGNCLSVFNYRG